MATAEVKEYKIVYLEWEDITSTDSGWRTPEDALDWSNSEVSIVRQVGFILDEDENYITLICSYLPPELVGNATRIPLSTVKLRKEISVANGKK